MKSKKHLKSGESQDDLGAGSHDQAIPPKEERPPVHASDEHAHRGKTACDDDCVGEGREGFIAEDYPGENPTRPPTNPQP